MKRLTYLVLAASLSLTMTTSLSMANTSKACMIDGFGETWDLTAVSTGGGDWIITGTVDVSLSSLWQVTGTGNSNTNSITLTAINPLADDCVPYIDYFTFSGYSYTGYTGGTWANFCDVGEVSSGTWTAGITKGSCGLLLTRQSVNGPALSNFRQLLFSSGINAKDQRSLFDFADETISVSASPTPARDQVLISYTLGQNSHVNVAVYNVLGQSVKVLVSQTKEAGMYSVNWDVADETGAIVPKGIYYLSVKTNSGLQTRAITIER